MSNSLAQTAVYAQSEHSVLIQQQKRDRLACVLKQNMRCYRACASSSKRRNGSNGITSEQELREPYLKGFIVLDYVELDTLD